MLLRVGAYFSLPETWNSRADVRCPGMGRHDELNMNYQYIEVPGGDRGTVISSHQRKSSRFLPNTRAHRSERQAVR
jgi:hypothetical protein